MTWQVGRARGSHRMHRISQASSAPRVLGKKNAADYVNRQGHAEDKRERIIENDPRERLRHLLGLRAPSETHSCISAYNAPLRLHRDSAFSRLDWEEQDLHAAVGAHQRGLAVSQAPACMSHRLTRVGHHVHAFTVEQKHASSQICVHNPSKHSGKASKGALGFRV